MHVHYNSCSLSELISGAPSHDASTASQHGIRLSLVTICKGSASSSLNNLYHICRMKTRSRHPEVYRSLLCKQARQLESLIRMAEARARLELVQIVTAQHAQVSSLLTASPNSRHNTISCNLCIWYMLLAYYHLACSTNAMNTQSH